MNGKNVMADDCLIQQTKRSRVNGSGPKRTELKTFYKIGSMPKRVLKELNYILDTNTSNDIGGDDYAISQNCDYEEVFNVQDKYRQILLQKTGELDPNVTNEYMYNIWDGNYQLRYTRVELDKIFKRLRPSMPRIYRFRMSEMGDGHELNWHIDQDTSVICRAQICLNENDSVLEFKDRQGIHKLKMKPGEVWFINTGWNHRVVAGNDIRRSAIFGFHFNDLIEKDILYK